MLSKVAEDEPYEQLYDGLFKLVRKVKKVSGTKYMDNNQMAWHDFLTCLHLPHAKYV